MGDIAVLWMTHAGFQGGGCEDGVNSSTSLSHLGSVLKVEMVVSSKGLPINKISTYGSHVVTYLHIQNTTLFSTFVGFLCSTDLLPRLYA